MKSTRRTFLTAATATTAAIAAKGGKAASPKITGIALSTIKGNFHKFVAMNSYDNAPKGTSYTNTLLRISTDSGVEGVGVMGYTRPDTTFLEDVRSLVGADPESVYDFHDGRIAGRSAAFEKLLVKYKHLDGPLCDLIGKLRGVPCWQLFGESVRDRVEVYDGTLYFSDLWFQDRGVQAVVDEASEAMRSGYRGIKLKIGRGSKWMEREEGLERDIEIIRAVRSAIGMEPKLLVDANNGYRGNFGGAWQLLESTKEQRLDWLEEVFPEDHELYQRLRRRMRRAGIKTPIADGENMRSAAEFDPYIQPERLFDVMQLDIRTGGILDCRKMSMMGEPHGAQAVPHNWGSQVGLLMSLHLAKTQKNIVGAEDDRSTCPALVVKGYRFKDGYYTVSDEPGLGVAVNEAFYEAPDHPQQTVIR
jgi:L-alanine-DL-glutamate epimerase-like enolase superfamily enzyme